MRFMERVRFAGDGLGVEFNYFHGFSIGKIGLELNEFFGVQKALRHRVASASGFQAAMVSAERVVDEYGGALAVVGRALLDTRYIAHICFAESMLIDRL